MKRILITTWLQGAGGVETHLLTLSRLLVAAGAEVTIAAQVCKPGVPLEALKDDIPVRLLTTPFSRTSKHLRLTMAWALATWPLRFGGRFDAMLGVGTGQFTRLLRRWIKPSGVAVGICVGELPSAEQSLAFSQTFDAVVAESKMQRAALRETLGDRLPIAVAPFVGHYSAPPARQPFTGNVLRLGFLGRYFQDKGIHRLVEIWPRLQIAPAELHFFGAGPEERELCDSIEARNLRANVFVHGGWSGAEELRPIMESIDLVVLPSKTEGLPVVLLEAMAYGVPFVATDVGMIRTLAEGNPDVTVVANDDDAIIAGIEGMAARIRSGSVDGRRLQQFHRQHYSFEKTAAVWVNALMAPEKFWKEQREHAPAARTAPEA